jgi:carbon storage regulator
MLIISRKKNESIVIQSNIEIILLDVQGDKARIGIDAPNDIKIMRKELLETEDLNKEALQLPDKADLRKLNNLLKNYPHQKNNK